MKQRLLLISIIFLGFLFSNKSFSQPLTADAGPDQNMCFGGSAVIGGSPTASFGTPPYTYSWSPSVGVACPTCSSTSVSPTSTTTYTVTVTDNLSNVSTDFVSVTVIPLPTISASNNAPLCEGDILTLFASFSAGASYSWTGPNAFSSSLQNPTIPSATLLNAGTYSVTATAFGCSSTVQTTVAVYPTPVVSITSQTNPSCFGGSNGSALASVSGGTPGYSYTWSPASQASANMVGVGAGNYTIAVVDANNCIGLNYVTLTEPPELLVNPSSATVCSGETVTLTSNVTGGTPPYNYNWDQGGTNYYTQDITINPVTGTSFTVSATDAAGCFANNFTSVGVMSLTNIYGYINYSLGAMVNGGQVVLLKYHPTFSSFDTIMVTNVDAGGMYYFNSVPHDDYIIKVFPNTVLYPNTIPTYYGNVFLWDDATIINHGCSMPTNASVYVQESSAGSGPGMLSGYILEGPGFQRFEGDPIPGIDVKLGRNPGGQLVTNTQTGMFGDFSFSNIPVNAPGEYYTIYVDMPGLMRDSVYNITVTASNYIFTQLDHKVDSNSVYPVYPVVTGISCAELIRETNFTAYPNPFKQNLTIAYTLKQDADVLVEVYDVLGVKHHSFVNSKQFAGRYTYSLENNMSSGVYFVRVTVNGQSGVIRVVKSE
jgi:hypothetical protein